MAKKSFQPQQPKEEKSDIITVDGRIEECLPGTLFRVRLTGDKDVFVLASIAGRMRQRRIHLLLGDLVTLEISAYDMTRARIVWRQG